jgi:hypothetical protein
MKVVQTERGWGIERDGALVVDGLTNEEGLALD